MRNLLTITALLLMSFVAQAKVKVTKIDLGTESNMGVVTINLNGKLKGTPELMIRDNLVQVAIPNTFVWPKIEKKVTVNKSFDSTLMAYQFEKNLVRVRTSLPYKLNGKEDQVSIVLGEKDIKLYFPKVKPMSEKIVKSLVKGESKAVARKQKIETKKEAEAYDESYLAQLLKDKEVTKNAPVQKFEKIENSLKNEALAAKTQVEDTVSNTVSSLEKGNFNVSSYVMKFIGFFALLVAGMYFVLNFFRKGMLKKGGLGFLSGTKMVEVINTTYLGPKRSLLMVRVNKQVFLLSQSEKGMDFLTEINDTADLFKEGEKRVTGNNFDTNLLDAESNDKEFKLKEVATELATGTDGVSVEKESLLKAVVEQSEDKVTLSKQIKNKLKELKPLQ